MTDFADELVRRMNDAARDLSSPVIRPKDAATLILVDRSTDRPKVLLGRRHQNHKFMPGKFVFPGGRVEPADRQMASAAHLDPQVEDRLMRGLRRPSPARARALVLAAIRETFEETGLLIGLRGLDAFTDHGATTSSMWAAFATAGVNPDLTNIHFVARAITPPGRSRRFDTRFFTADASSVTARVRGRGRSRYGAGRTRLDLDRGGQAPRHAGDHHGGARRTRAAGCGRSHPRPAGAVLSYAAPAVFPRSPLKSTRNGLENRLV